MFTSMQPQHRAVHIVSNLVLVHEWYVRHRELPNGERSKGAGFTAHKRARACARPGDPLWH